MGVQWWYMYLRIGVGYRGENIHIGLTQRVDDGGLSPVHKMTNNMENLQKEKYCYVFFSFKDSLTEYCRSEKHVLILQYS